jgi:acyl carrier protein
VDDREVFEVVRDAIIWAKADVIQLAPAQVSRSSVLSDLPICLDSLEAIAMVTHLEEALDLVAEDEHFFTRSIRTVDNVVDAVKDWMASVRSTGANA